MNIGTHYAAEKDNYLHCLKTTVAATQIGGGSESLALK